MANQKLIDYINQETSLGVTQEKMKSDLVVSGWQETDINQAFESIKKSFSVNRKSLNFKKILIIIGIILAGIILVGGTVYGYNAYFYSPEKNIEKMMIGLKDVRAVEYSGELKVIANTPASALTIKKSSNFLLVFSGLTDNINPADLKSSLILNLKSDVLGEDEASIALEIRLISKLLYLKLTNIPSIGFFDLSSLSNKWMKFEQSIIEEGIKNNETLNNKLGTSSSTPTQKQVLSEKIDQLNIILKKKGVVKVIETLKSETMEGQNTYHYKYSVDKSALKEVVPEANLLITGKSFTAEELSRSNKQLDQIEFIDGEIWIGKKDFRLYKVSLNVKTIASAEKPETNQINLVLFLKKFNAPAKIEAPQDAQSAMEILSSLFSGMSTGSSSEMLDQSESILVNSQSDSDYMDTDSDALSDSWEIEFNTDINNPDTDGDGLKDGEELDYQSNPNDPDTDDDGFLDGQEVKGGYNPIGAGNLRDLNIQDKIDYGAKNINDKNSSSLITLNSASNNGSVSSPNIIDALESARIKARDERRLSDVKQIQVALEMYYNEMGFYPSVSEFLSKSIKTEASTYLVSIPEALLPADGSCVDKEGSNRYTYKTDSNGSASQTYTLTYCLGNDVDNIKAGVNTASEKGTY